jgi:hypothetical protein
MRMTGQGPEQLFVVRNASFAVEWDFRSWPKTRLFQDPGLMRNAIVLVFLYAVLSVSPHSAIAQETQSPRSGPMEEVIVRAPRSLRSMREAIEDAEDRAFDIFNELNTDDDYDIVCRREEPTGSRIPVRNCRARFVDRLLREKTREALSLGGGAPADLPLLEIRHHMALLAEKIEALASENATFLEATIEVQIRKDEFASATAARDER